MTSCTFAWRQQRRYSCQILYQATRNTLLSTIVCTSSMLLMRAAHSGILPSTYARTLPRFPEKSGSIVLSTRGTKAASTIHTTFASIASNAERPTCAKSFCSVTRSVRHVTNATRSVIVLRRKPAVIWTRLHSFVMAVARQGTFAVFRPSIPTMLISHNENTRSFARLPERVSQSPEPRFIVSTPSLTR